VLLCHVGLVKDHVGYLVDQSYLSLFEVLKNNRWKSNKHGKKNKQANIELGGVNLQIKRACLCTQGVDQI